jgi:hypothetical protein
LRASLAPGGALSAIRAVKATGPRESMVLTSGATLPVRPKYPHNLVSAGMLKDQSVSRPIRFRIPGSVVMWFPPL